MESAPAKCPKRNQNKHAKSRYRVSDSAAHEPRPARTLLGGLAILGLALRVRAGKADAEADDALHA